MKSVGEAMAIGRTFQESFQKAMRSLETGLDGWSLPPAWKRMPKDKLVYNMRVPNPDRMLVVRQAMEDGVTEEEVYEYTKMDPWFISQLGELHRVEEWLKGKKLEDLTSVDFLQVKQRGFSDSQIARAVGEWTGAGWLAG